MKELNEYLSSCQVGKLERTSTLEKILYGIWDQFEGASEQGTTGYKLLGRMENISWNPPHLKFTLERHGRTVNHSSRADLHDWTLDLDKRTATCKTGRFRQLESMSSRFDVKPIAREIANCIISGLSDERLKWYSPVKVAYLSDKIIPSSCAQTTIGRRKRFRQELEMIINDYGWAVRQRSNICEKGISAP